MGHIYTPFKGYNGNSKEKQETTQQNCIKDQHMQHRRLQSVTPYFKKIIKIMCTPIWSWKPNRQQTECEGYVEFGVADIVGFLYRTWVVCSKSVCVFFLL